MTDSRNIKSPPGALGTKLAKPTPGGSHGAKPTPGGPLGAKPAAAAERSEGRRRFAAGEVIFNQGDPGGDLFFIEDGAVEIFQSKENETIILSEMGPGEIIGVMTCMTMEKRMASARAKTPVLCKKVPHDAIRKVLQALPNWMKIVLKEFTIRLTQMNKMYTESVVKVKKLESTQISNVYVAALIASAFATTAEFLAITTDVGKIVVLDEVLQKLESMLNMKREDIDRIWTCMVESNLLKIEIEADKKRNITRLENARKLTYFAQFVRDSKVGPTKRYLRARFSNKETRVLSGLVKYAQRLEMDLDKSCRLMCADLEKSLERATGIKWERDALQKGIDLKLVTVEGEGGDEAVVFRPAEMGRTVACVEAIRRLNALDTKAPADAGKGEAA
jgi:CRP-like cAMP-binding protein